jgi:hypothetical protein
MMLQKKKKKGYLGVIVFEVQGLRMRTYTPI